MKPDSTSKDWRNSIRVAIIHEWFIDYSGSERVVEQMLNIFPQADLYAQVEFLPDNLRGFIKNKKVNTSFIQKLPGAKTKYRNYLPLMPLAVEQFDMSKYDLVISSNHAVAKGVITGFADAICLGPYPSLFGRSRPDKWSQKLDSKIYSA